MAAAVSRHRGNISRHSCWSTRAPPGWWNRGSAGKETLWKGVWLTSHYSMSLGSTAVDDGLFTHKGNPMLCQSKRPRIISDSAIKVVLETLSLKSRMPKSHTCETWMELRCNGERIPWNFLQGASIFASSGFCLTLIVQYLEPISKIRLGFRARREAVKKRSIHVVCEYF